LPTVPPRLYRAKIWQLAVIVCRYAQSPGMAAWQEVQEERNAMMPPTRSTSRSWLGPILVCALLAGGTWAATTPAFAQEYGGPVDPVPDFGPNGRGPDVDPIPLPPLPSLLPHGLPRSVVAVPAVPCTREPCAASPSRPVMAVPRAAVACSTDGHAAVQRCDRLPRSPRS